MMKSFLFKIKSFAILLLLSLMILNCSKDTATENPNFKEVVSYTVDQINSFLILSQFYSGTTQYSLDVSKIKPKIKYSLKSYKMIYNTTNYDGKPVAVSGIVLIPQNISNPKFGIVLHGTITDSSKTSASAVPSLLTSASNTNPDVVTGLFLASTGSIVFIPDYIGYGESLNTPHPYLHKKTLASSSVDMIKDFLKNYLPGLNLNPTFQIFVTGYSEGGMSALAVHQSLEENPISYNSKNIEIGVCVAGGVPSMIVRFADSIFSKNINIGFLPTYVWSLSAYNTIYGLNMDKNTVFSSASIPLISSFDDFQYAKFSNSLSKNPSILFSQNFITKFSNKDASLQNFINALKENEFTNWTPKGKLVMVHGSADDFVYPFQSIETVANMKNRGATNVSLVLQQNGNHVTTAIGDYLNEMFKEISTFAP